MSKKEYSTKLVCPHCGFWNDPNKIEFKQCERFSWSCNHCSKSFRAEAMILFTCKAKKPADS